MVALPRLRGAAGRGFEVLFGRKGSTFSLFGTTFLCFRILGHWLGGVAKSQPRLYPVIGGVRGVRPQARRVQLTHPAPGHSCPMFPCITRLPRTIGHRDRRHGRGRRRFGSFRKTCSFLLRPGFQRGRARGACKLPICIVFRAGLAPAHNALRRSAPSRPNATKMS